MKSFTDHHILAFCQTLISNLHQEVRPLGKAKGLRSEDKTLSTRVWVPGSKSLDEITPAIIESAKEMANVLNGLEGPLEFHVLQKPSVEGGIINTVRMNTVCVQQRVSYHGVERKLCLKFFVKYKAAETHTLPVQSYEDEIVKISRFEQALEELNQDFKKQPWTQAILDQRQKDNESRMSMHGRTYEVTHIHLNQAYHMFGHGTDRLFGYQLIEVPEEKYLQDHFKDGQRIT